MDKHLDKLFRGGELLILLGTAILALSQGSSFYTGQLSDLETKTYQQSIFGELKAQRYCEDSPSPNEVSEYEMERIEYHNQSADTINELLRRNYSTNRIESATLCLGYTSYANKMHSAAVEDIDDSPTAMKEKSVNASMTLIYVGLLFLWTSIIGKVFLWLESRKAQMAK
ncbi:MAG: hypothetical protein ACLFRK_03390, partial [Candidatus Nanohaloarchaea archaeon]